MRHSSNAESPEGQTASVPQILKRASPKFSFGPRDQLSFRRHRSAASRTSTVALLRSSALSWRIGPTGRDAGRGHGEKCGLGTVPARDGHGASRCPASWPAKSRIRAQARRRAKVRRVAVAPNHQHRVMRQCRIRNGRGAEFRVFHDTGGHHQCGGHQGRHGGNTGHLSKHTYSSGRVWPLAIWIRSTQIMSWRN